MEQVTLGDGTTMPRLGLGVFLVTDVAQCERSVTDALRAGYRLVDTAAVYGNERAVGRAVAASGVPRDELYLTTKIWTTDAGRRRTRAAVEESLERLGTPYVDLMLLHQPFGDVAGAWAALEEAVADGVVRSVGVSNFGVDDLTRLLDVATVRPVVDQVERHPYFQQDRLASFLAGHGIVPEAWYPLGHGSAELLGEPVLVELAGRYGKTPAQVVLRWHLQSGWVAIPKSTDPRHIAQNVDVVDFALTEEEMARIAALDRGRPAFRVPRWAMAVGTRLTRVRDLG